MKRERISIYVSSEAADRMREIAERRAIGVNDTLRLAMGLLDQAEHARENGKHFGIASHKSALDTVLVLPI